MLSRTKTIGTVGYMGGIMSLPEPFVWSWTQMIQFNRESLCQEDEKIDYVRAQVSLHPSARNELVGKMKGEWLLQLDTDMVFDPDFCARLVSTMQRYKLDILTGLYTYKNHPQIPTLYMFNESNGRHEPIGSWDESLDVFEIGSSGGGCLLIRRAVFEKIISDIKQPPFEMIPPYGEDHSFYMRARKLGFKAHCAWKVQAAHLGYKQVVHQPDANLPFLNQYAVTGYGTRKGV